MNMKRYIVKFIEKRQYEMIVDALDQESAIQHAKRGPENPIWVNTGLEDFGAEEIAEGQL
jgi:hypothetical protein